ncbi:unnamed protein product [Protopolystoma xenopodis]|uniref:Uncharacterized protein n=1 Tax=Protopolystoma xenopodis TaxID=117903 RepID=A0A448X180_9PLAT|nr:unnamed protein product [Protopolystoma xenopodis]
MRSQPFLSAYDFIRFRSNTTFASDPLLKYSATQLFCPCRKQPSQHRTRIYALLILLSRLLPPVQVSTAAECPHALQVAIYEYVAMRPGQSPASCLLTIWRLFLLAT